MIWTENGGPFDLPVLNDVRGVVSRQVCAHVSAIRIEQHHTAAFPTVQSELLPEEVHGERAVLELLGRGDHEPPAWKREFAQTIFLCLGHVSAPTRHECPYHLRKV